jgi:hypothetical protein
MVFKHFQDSLNLEDLTNGFIQLHQLCSHVIANHIFESMVQVIGASWLLALAKPSNGISSIEVGKRFIGW